jgi:hypothetical protein
MKETLNVLGRVVITPIKWMSLAFAVYGLSSGVLLHSGKSFTIGLAALILVWPVSPRGLQRREDH